MKHQLQLNEVEGKTIKKVFADYSNQILMVFEDGLFCVIYGYGIDDEVTLDNGDFWLDDWGDYARELFDLGVVTESQLKRYVDDQERQAAKCKEERRKQFEAMKAEFE